MLTQSEAINVNVSPASDSTTTINVSILMSAKWWTSAAPIPHSASTPQDPTSASVPMDLSYRGTKQNASKLKMNVNPWRWNTAKLGARDRGRGGKRFSRLPQLKYCFGFHSILLHSPFFPCHFSDTGHSFSTEPSAQFHATKVSKFMWNGFRFAIENQKSKFIPWAMSL